MIIGENRLELLMLEVQEEHERLLRAIFLALGVAAFGLLAGMALTGVTGALAPGSAVSSAGPIPMLTYFDSGSEGACDST